ncbi:hypothetical protein ACLPHM_03505 [Paenalcaligenes sp. Me131]|uniref:hypothetical protein n=1 Tax=Paenalcaligenes sp. Me131 TaxID=3392636 RepID=UPI003D2D62BD
MSQSPKTPSVAVWVHWIPYAQGGKKTLPQDHLYYVVTEALPCTLPDPCAWSLVLAITENDDAADEHRYGVGYAHFLMDNAPSALLISGFTVAIYEGPHKVGLVEVI